MASNTAITRARRALRKRRMGRLRKNKINRLGSTPILYVSRHSGNSTEKTQPSA